MTFRAFGSMLRVLLATLMAAVLLAPVQAESQSVVMEHDGSTIMFEPYAAEHSSRDAKPAA